MIEFGREVCGELEAATGREWLETNGLGGFASSTLAGLNTRRYHGLLVAATRPPVGRTVLLSKLEESVFVGGRRYELSSNQYPGTVHPRGHLLLKRFRLDPFPVFTYAVGELEIEKTVFMRHGENTTVIHYELRGHSDDAANVRLEVRPLVAFRDYHQLGRGGERGEPRATFEDSCVVVEHGGEAATRLYLAHDAREVEPSGLWYRNFEYAEERARGFDFREDLFSPCALAFDLGASGAARVVASTERRDAEGAAEYRRAEVERRARVVASAPASDEFARALTSAADQYVVARGRRRTVIAGYHWFGDWGRDTMIALPGLTLITGRFDVARSILAEFARHVSQGMLPNRFTEGDEAPEYNTVDATLWYFEAVRALVAYTGDAEFVREHLYAVLRDIVEWHERGTRYRIRVDEDGLLAAGVEGAQLTWMDAKVGGRVITPRHGKAVEIQALWYNALRTMEEFAREFGLVADEGKYAGMASRARDSFNVQFWNEEADCLYDVVDGTARDASLRPNQIFAVSLRHSMLSAEQARFVVDAVEREMLTPYGLRSLAPSDPQYSGRYSGGPAERDAVYHQGAVWAWLIGPFVTAYLKVHGRTPETLGRARNMLAPLVAHLKEACLGHVSEIFEGDAPHAPRGAAAQAWSVAELLRTLVEDVQGVTPGAPSRAHEEDETRPRSTFKTAPATTFQQAENFFCKDSRARATNGRNEPLAAGRAVNHFPNLPTRLL
ncbi:MAG TPA: amylo-alpha-1,6-glucosidase [Pyrinomonadaceae bacterium]|nr:amylo-alpha-1,6-glucosidase [Pyrinomonadaceae bacterium]